MVKGLEFGNDPRVVYKNSIVVGFEAVHGEFYITLKFKD